MTKTRLKDRRYYNTITKMLDGRIEVNTHDIIRMLDSINYKHTPSNQIIAKILESNGFEQVNKNAWVRCM